MRMMNQYDLLFMLSDVLEGLRTIHQKSTIHRDIKPENIIYKEGTFKITDFGIAVNKEEDNSFTLSVNGSRPLLLNLDDLGNLKLKLNHEKGSLEIEQEGLPERGLLDESVNAADPLPSEPPPANLLETTFAK